MTPQVLAFVSLEPQRIIIEWFPAARCRRVAFSLRCWDWQLAMLASSGRFNYWLFSRRPVINVEAQVANATGLDRRS